MLFALLLLPLLISSPTVLSLAPSVTYRVFGVDLSPGDHIDAATLKKATLKVLTGGKMKKAPDSVSVKLVRRSVDARKRILKTTGPRYSHVVDVTVPAGWGRVKEVGGRVEIIDPGASKWDVMGHFSKASLEIGKKKEVVIVGAGPAGLFATLLLSSHPFIAPILLERGQPVESRGRDIGALQHRRVMNGESNFAFGEGGAGTWSDGKLTTRIGRNSNTVRFVLETLVEHGAPEGILESGSPHLGTDNLVKILRSMRSRIREQGGQVHFGCKVVDIDTKDNAIRGVKVVKQGVTERSMRPNDEGREIPEYLACDTVIVSTGHSARDFYDSLYKSNVKLEPKGFAVGFRVEHPQAMINRMQLGDKWARSVITGRGSTDTANESDLTVGDSTVPVPSYRLATDRADDGSGKLRGAYSFCMCPGGQIVPASTKEGEVCVNGMSFSRRDSKFANSALVVTIDPDDDVLEPWRKEHGVMAGLRFQEEMERKASILGGGNFVVPVQRVTDFVRRRTSVDAPDSSYRLGVKPSACHEIYPEQITNAVSDAIENIFDKSMPGFCCEEGLLHGVETRTSSPLRIERDPDTYESSVKGLMVAGEGAGFAGGIVSAAADGVGVADAILRVLGAEGMGEGYAIRESY